MAAVDFFLKLDGIDGESTDKAHEKWIEIQSFSWGASNPATIGSTSGGAGAGKSIPSDFTFSIPMSAASPQIFIKMLTGRSIDYAALSARKAGREQQEFLKIKLSDVFISSYNTEGGGDAPMESISLRFVKIDFSYTPQVATGALGTPIAAAFDFVKNAEA
jgi:type VI secretion system secreted protein Hcp